MPLRRQHAALPLLLTSLLLAGCGGGGDEAASTTVAPPVTEPATTTTEPATTTTAVVTTTAPAQPAADLTGRAKAATLQRGDFPAGWEPVPDAETGGLSIEKVWGEVTGCLGVSSQSTGSATSPTFLRGLATQARTTVEYTSEASSTAIAAALAGPKLQGCATQAFTADAKRSAPEGGVPGPVTVAPLGGPPIAPKATALRITLSISLDELKVPLFQDFLVIFTKGALIRAFFLNAGSEFPRELERSLLDKVVGRA